MEVTDGETAVYWHDEVNSKGDVFLKLQDSRIVKSELTHLVASGYSYGRGEMHFRGIRL